MMMRKRKRNEVPGNRVVEKEPAPSSDLLHEVTEEGRNEELSGNRSPARIPEGFTTMVSHICMSCKAHLKACHLDSATNYVILMYDLQVRDSGGRQAVIFAVSCHGHQFRLDRLARVKRFVDEHSSYRPEWRALGKKAGESDEQHLQRLKQIFVFSAANSVGTVGPSEGKFALQPSTDRFVAPKQCHES